MQPIQVDAGAPTGASSVQEMILKDLARSGLVPQDMNIRQASHLEFSALQTSGSLQGYTIPYFDMFGRARPFYRVRLFNSTIKYKQPKNTTNSLYFPRQFMQTVVAQRDNPIFKGKPTIVIVEGEKKAARLVKSGVPAIGLGGVDSWRNRNFLLPEGSELAKAGKENIRAKVPAGTDDLIEDGFSILATGLPELIDYVHGLNAHLVICFDRDINREVHGQSGMKAEVQRAAATFAFELRFRGLPYNNLHQLILPPLNAISEEEKVGVDDFLEHAGHARFEQLLSACLDDSGSFPRHPNIREHIGRKLQKVKMQRKEAQALTLAILSDLDATGSRLRSEDEKQSYYFDRQTTKLVKVTLNMPNRNQIHETSFGQMLYKRYGLSAADARTLTWLDAQYHGEDPIQNVTPYRVFARPSVNKDELRFQLSDSEYALVTTDPDPEKALQIKTNGDDGILFEADQVEAIDGQEVKKAFLSMYQQYDAASLNSPIPCWWDDVLQQVRLKDQDSTRRLAAMLFYISPWLFKWRGTQLPVELIIGESGSGKSSLCEHRLNILTGNPKLRNAPESMKDWHASITNTGGLHIIDNVQLLDKALRQRLSDEICRLVTEPQPRVEMRRLYTNNELVTVPVDCVFSMTAVKQPFVQADLLARSFIIELDKEEAARKMAESAGSDGNDAVNITYDANWVSNQMQRFGGRASWIAHHLLVIHKFFRMVNREWSTSYKAVHRLVNVEQAMMMMGKVFQKDMTWLPSHVVAVAQDATADSDWVLEGLIAFANFKLSQKAMAHRWTASEISTWALGSDMYAECQPLVNPRSLGKYMQSHKNVISVSAGLFEFGSRNNAITYGVRPTRMNSKGLY